MFNRAIFYRSVLLYAVLLITVSCSRGSKDAEQGIATTRAESKAKLQDELSQLVKRRETAIGDLAHLRGSRERPQSKAEFEANEEEIEKKEKVETEAAKNAYLKAYEDLQKLKLDDAGKATTSEDQMKLIEKEGEVDQKKNHLDELMLRQPLARKHRMLDHKLELETEKLVEALDRQIDAISRQVE